MLNVRSIQESLKRLGIDLPEDQLRPLYDSLKAVDVQMRPMELMQWIRQNLDLSLRNVEFFDLLHYVRAKLRLAVWEKMVGYDLVTNELRAAAKAELSGTKKYVSAKIDKFKASFNDKNEKARLLVTSGGSKLKCVQVFN